ncbi:YhgE/Pip family protein [Lacticaseibacillus parakribbianus]|uniref:YhgE/Pip family protein n=1 Tax=Lacticaseibacillus parakribbianus TaxID=2970927 RepID=UPI0021CAE476|nr:YhgE/Pip domain-containing protein [Lacticaseibacillus parakribbianus]
MTREFRSIAKHKGLIAAMLVILFIPFAYSFCFLTSAWDPYGNTGKIPVAVVNLDQPATLEGKTISAGRDTVAQLKDDKQLKWVFCTPEAAKKGLAQNKYYTVVTLPKNFSANAATVLDAHPKQMKLTYQTNGSLNYVSEIISQVGADKLNAQIREKVTTAFAQALFAKVSEIGSKLKEAKDGAAKLVAGQTTLSDGLRQYTGGVSQVDDGLSQLNGKVPALASGVGQLAAGGQQLQTGLGQLNSKAPALASGVGQLNGGLGQLNSKTPALASGVGQIDGGLGKINAEVNGDTQDTDLAAGVSQLTTGSAQLADALGQLNAKAPALTAGITQLQQAIAGFQKQLVDQNLVGRVEKLNKTVQSSVNLFNIAYTSFGTGSFGTINMLLPTQMASLTDAQKKATAEAKKLEVAQTKANDEMEAVIAALPEDQQAAAKAAFTKVKASQATTQTALTTAGGLIDVVHAQMSDTGVDAAGDPKGLAVAVKTLAAGLTTKNPDPTGQNKDGYTFSEAIAALNDGATELDNQVNKTDKTPAEQKKDLPLKAAAAQMAAGAKTLAKGLRDLNKKAPGLATGISQLYAGSHKLNAAVPALRGGVSQLYAGSTQLNNAVPALQSGVKQLYDGSVKEANGLSQLNGQVPALTDGVGQLYDGTQQLTAKNKQLTSGAGQLLAGNTQLSTGLDDGYQQIVATKLTNLTAKMFAAPSTDVQLKYTAVKNYGAALAPYVLALALFVAIIIFNFAYPLKRSDDDDRSPMQWLLGKLAVGTLVAAGAALIEATLMLVMMHLPVANVVGFYGITLLFALAAQYLTMVLTLAFNRVGIFIALGLLTLSGSGGLFPAETISPLYEATQKFLPMTYAINGYREVITGGMATSTTVTSVIILLAVGLLSLALMIPAVMWHQGAKASD